LRNALLPSMTNRRRRPGFTPRSTRFTTPFCRPCQQLDVYAGPLAGVLGAGQLLGRDGQHRFDRRPTSHVDQFIDGYLRLLNEFKYR